MSSNLCLTPQTLFRANNSKPRPEDEMSFNMYSTPLTKSRPEEEFSCNFSLVPLTKSRPEEEISCNFSSTPRTKCRPEEEISSNISLTPRLVLVIKKINDSSIVPDFVKLIDWLVNTKKVKVAIQQKVLKEQTLTQNQTFLSLQEQLRIFSNQDSTPTNNSGNSVDLIMTLGGDGTLLYTATLFPGPVPPILPFCHGSLGFLTPHRFHNFQHIVTKALAGQTSLTLRSRLRCSLNTEETLVLNEVAISRKQSSSMCYLNLHLNGQFLTSVQGDGLIVSTSTGSTAYAASLGSSLIHPSVGGILVVPMNSHSLSSRPVLVPADVELRVSVSPASRDDTVHCSFDGRGRNRLSKGQSLVITASQHSVPCIAAQDPSIDWFSSLKTCLQWNERTPQKNTEEVIEEAELPLGENNANAYNHEARRGSQSSGYESL